MKLTLFTDYALRVLIYLGTRPERLCSIGEVARAYGVSQNHLMKVVNRLARQGYVESMRGRTCGIRLGRPPVEINLGALVRDTEDGFLIADEDFRLRGGGDVLGTRQAGQPGFRLADPVEHEGLLTTANRDAAVLLSRDPGLTSERGMAVRVLLRLFYRAHVWDFRLRRRLGVPVLGRLRLSETMIRDGGGGRGARGSSLRSSHLEHR